MMAAAAPRPIVPKQTQGAFQVSSSQDAPSHLHATALSHTRRRTVSHDDHHSGPSGRPGQDIQLTPTTYAQQHNNYSVLQFDQSFDPASQLQLGEFQQQSANRISRSRSLFRRPSTKGTTTLHAQKNIPPVPRLPILQHSGKNQSRLLSLDDNVLIHIAKKLDHHQLFDFAHLSRRCREIAAKTLTVLMQNTVLKATLGQERKAVFSLEFIFQHLDPASMHVVFRASQLKSRRYFENNVMARPTVQALTIVTPNGIHHPLFQMAGFDDAQDMTESDLEQATTLLTKPFHLDIKDKGYYRVSPTTTLVVDTPFFPSQPLMDMLVPSALEGTQLVAPTWEMMYKVDYQSPNYPMRMQQQQEKITLQQQQEAAAAAAAAAAQRSATSRHRMSTSGSGHFQHVASGLPPAMPNLVRKPTVVKPPPGGWGPLPPTAPPPAVPASLTYQLGTRTSMSIGGGGGPAADLAPLTAAPLSPKASANMMASPSSPVSPSGNRSGFGGHHLPTGMEHSCVEPELAEETERFLTLLFIQLPFHTLIPHTAERAAAQKKPADGYFSSWITKSKIGRSLTQKKASVPSSAAASSTPAGGYKSHGRSQSDYSALDQRGYGK